MTMTRLEDYESYNGKYIVQLTKDQQRSPESKKYKTFDQAKRAGINCLKSERYFESAFDMTREEWLECSLVDEIPNEFYIRQIETYKPTPWAEDILDRISENYMDEFDTCDDIFIYKSDEWNELTDRLYKCLRDWMNDYCYAPNCYYLKDIAYFKKGSNNVEYMDKLVPWWKSKRGD